MDRKSRPLIGYAMLLFASFTLVAFAAFLLFRFPCGDTNVWLSCWVAGNTVLSLTDLEVILVVAALVPIAGVTLALYHSSGRGGSRQLRSR